MGQLIPPEQQPLRHEQKYYISPGDAQYLSLLLRRTMQTDPHANARNEYHIRSLYFDDCFNSAMSDKLDGVMHRHKYRIRIYNFSDKIIRLERKSKRGDYISKLSCSISRPGRADHRRRPLRAGDAESPAAAGRLPHDDDLSASPCRDRGLCPRGLYSSLRGNARHLR